MTMKPRTMTGISMTMGAVGLAVGLALAPTPAVSQAPAQVTPKTQTPNEARALSRSFAAVAKALRPSVVRLDVETVGEPRADRRRPSPESVPPEMRRWFERFFGEDMEQP